VSSRVGESVTREIEASADRTPVLQKGAFFTDFWYRRR